MTLSHNGSPRVLVGLGYYGDHKESACVSSLFCACTSVSERGAMSWEITGNEQHGLCVIKSLPFQIETVLTLS